MNRLYWSQRGDFLPGEFLIHDQEGISIYDGNEKSDFENGLLNLSSHRLRWNGKCPDEKSLSLDLSTILLAEEEHGKWLRSDKIILKLNQCGESSSLPGPKDKSNENFIKLSFKEGGHESFLSKLSEALAQQQWQIPSFSKELPTSHSSKKRPLRQIATGIGGIEKYRKEKMRETDLKISKAFQDLDQLMEMAKPMVILAKQMSQKIHEKQATEDETIQFKSYLLSLGISDPVTRDNYGSGNNYFKQLAKEVFTILENPIKENGGIITLTDAFCRVNRARGMELLSPDDLLSACKMLKNMELPINLLIYDSGVSVLVTSLNEEEIIARTLNQVKTNMSLTAEELSRKIGLSVVLSRERLIVAEKVGLLCRDESVQGLRFYPNTLLSL